MSEKPLTLRRKLFLAGKAAQAVEKNGSNREHRFKYVRAEDVLAEAERVLEKQGILIIPSSPSVEIRFLRAGGAIAKATVEFEVTDTKTGETFTKTWVGTGFDTPGDKATYAAQTGARKYFMGSLLGIPITTDPEEDKAPESEADKVRARQDEAAEAPDVPPALRPVPDPQSASIEDEIPADVEGLS